MIQSMKHSGLFLILMQGFFSFGLTHATEKFTLLVESGEVRVLSIPSLYLKSGSRLSNLSVSDVIRTERPKATLYLFRNDGSNFRWQGDQRIQKSVGDVIAKSTHVNAPVPKQPFDFADYACLIFFGGFAICVLIWGFKKHPFFDVLLFYPIYSILMMIISYGLEKLTEGFHISNIALSPSWGLTYLILMILGIGAAIVWLPKLTLSQQEIEILADLKISYSFLNKDEPLSSLERDFIKNSSIPNSIKRKIFFLDRQKSKKGNQNT